MATQKQVNEACQMIKRDGDTITIAKVRRLLGKNDSFFEVADKVLLFKEDPNEAKSIAQSEKTVREVQAPGLLEVIEQAVKKSGVRAPENLSIALCESLQSYIDQSVLEQTQKINETLLKTRRLNDHIEVRYYGLKARFEAQSAEHQALKDEHYKLQQALQNTKIGKGHQQTSENKLLEMRDYQTQLSLLKGDRCAAYDPKRKQIVVKVPVKHRLIKEFEKGARSFQLRADAVFDFASKYWLLENFEAQTINLLVRNKFIISKELAELLQFLEARD